MGGATTADVVAQDSGARPEAMIVEAFDNATLRAMRVDLGESEMNGPYFHSGIPRWERSLAPMDKG